MNSAKRMTWGVWATKIEGEIASVFIWDPCGFKCQAKVKCMVVLFQKLKVVIIIYAVVQPRTHHACRGGGGWVRGQAQLDTILHQVNT